MDLMRATSGFVSDTAKSWKNHAKAQRREERRENRLLFLCVLCAFAPLRDSYSCKSRTHEGLAWGRGIKSWGPRLV